MTKEASVYLICDPDKEIYKIGVTRGSVENRLKKLQTGNGAQLFVMGVHRTKNPFLIEKMLHNHYNTKNELNEWFRLDTNDVGKFLDTCNMMEDRLKILRENHFMKNKIKVF